MSKDNGKNTNIKGAVVAKAIVKAKGVRSDRLPRRETLDRFTGLLITKEHHSSVAGQVDRGLNSSPFEVTSISNRTGEIIRTRHREFNLAARAAIGRRAHHKIVSLIDHTPVAQPSLAEKAYVEDPALEKAA